MKYNFDKFTDRSNTDATKWYVLQDVLNDEEAVPLWIADMDFAVSDPILDALKKRMECPAFGYTERGRNYNETMADWFNRRHHYDVKPEELIMSIGVMYSVSAAIRLFSKEGDKIIIPTPAYEPFFDKTYGTQREPLISPMIEENGVYKINFKQLEKEIDEKTRIFMLCNPHNPTGHAYTMKELEEIAAFCEKHELVIISDEIHADFVYEKGTFYPIMNINEYTRMHTVACVSCTKSFNLAGLKISAAIIKNPEWMKRFKAEAATVGIHSINIFALEAMKAAYQSSEDWFDQMLEYVRENRDFAYAYIKEKMPCIKLHKPDATYFLWLDMRNCNIPLQDVQDTCLKEGRVYLSEGKFFGKDFLGFERINLACPRFQLEKGLQGLECMINKYNH